MTRPSVHARSGESALQRCISALLLIAGTFGLTPSAHSGAGLTGFTVDPGPTKTPPPIGIVPASKTKTLSIPDGSEFCGVDDVFGNGYEAATFSLLTQLNGGVASPGLATDITAALSSVAITSPLSGATTGESTLDVSGTFTGPVNTGVVVNGISGYTTNGFFLVPNVPLTSGITNVLNVTGKTLTGATLPNSRSISQSGTASPVAIQVNHPTGYAPSPITFAFSIGVLPSGFPVQTVAINWGTGSGNFSGSSLAGAPTVYTYKVPGLYTASLTVTDTHSNVYTGYRSVLIQDLAVQRGMLCDVYGYLKSQLKAGSASGAAAVFQPAVQNQYMAMFNALGNTNMSTVADQLGLIASGFLGQGFAEFLLVRDDSGTQTRAGFPMRLTQGADGVWRISEM